jgi:hypothetical protein
MVPYKQVLVQYVIPVDIEVVRWFADLESSMGFRALMVACNSFILDAEVNMG